MDWAEFEKTVEWARLSVRQKMWLRTYVESGNKNQVLATTCAYGTSSGENARLFSYKVVRQKKIQAAMNRYWNRSPQDIWLQELQAELKTMKSGSAAQLKLQRLITKALAGGKLPSKKRGAKSHEHISTVSSPKG
jgi:hypothetical protein